MHFGQKYFGTPKFTLFSDLLVPSESLVEVVVVVVVVVNTKIFSKVGFEECWGSDGL